MKRVFNFGGNVSDSDADGLPDAWELAHASSLAVLTGGTQDADLDGLANSSEYALRTHPTNPDMDADNVLDGDEVAFGWDPKVSTLADTAKTESLSYDAAH